MAKLKNKHELLKDNVMFELSYQKSKNFKAKSIPITSTVEKYKQMEEERKQRSKKNVEERKQQVEQEREKILKKQCPRLLEQEVEYREKLEKKKTQKTYEEEHFCTFKPKVQEIPENMKSLMKEKRLQKEIEE